MAGRADELRYVLTTIMPEVKDSEFTWEDYQARGTMNWWPSWATSCTAVWSCHKYYDGKVPSSSGAELPEELKALFTSNADEVSEAIMNYKFREAMQLAMTGARIGNKYLAETEPWKLIKTDEAGVADILGNALKIIAHLIETLGPLLPGTVERLKEMLGKGLDEHGHIKEGGTLGEVKLLFQKVEDEDIAKQKEKLQSQHKLNSPQPSTPMKAEIDFETFSKMDLRTGTITKAEAVKGADKAPSVESGYRP